MQQHIVWCVNQCHGKIKLHNKEIETNIDDKKYPTLLGQNYIKMAVVTCQIHTISIYFGLFEQENCVVRINTDYRCVINSIFLWTNCN